MKKLDFKLLNDSEKELILAVRPKELRKLDEDELIDLHKRVRRARNKYSKLYRRRASEHVGRDRTRAKASKRSHRVAAKAEIFEDALAKVSRRLGRVARENADALREERLAAARGGSSAPDRSHPPKRKDTRGDKNLRGRAKQPVERRSVASSRSEKRRHEALRAIR